MNALDKVGIVGMVLGATARAAGNPVFPEFVAFVILVLSVIVFLFSEPIKEHLLDQMYYEGLVKVEVKNGTDKGPKNQ